MPKSAGKQMSINIIASIVSFAVTVGINFFLTPYLVKEVGSDAYGFIGLANNFVQYATIVTTALNSISGRFISIAYHKGDVEKSSKIFSSVLVADLFLAAVMLILSSIFVCFLDTVLKIPSNLVSGVKITFAFAFLTFVVSTVTAIFTTAAFVKNRIDINSIRDIISNLIKVALIVLLFAIFPAQLYFVTLASFGSGIFLLLANITVKKKVLPEVKADIRKFDIKIVKTLLASGIWLSLAQLCQVLLSGLDLLICNLTLGTALMGLLSIAKTVPNSIGNLTVILGSVFTPHYTILYAKKKNTGANYRGEIQYQNCKLYTLDSYCRFYCLWQTVLHIMATDKVTGGDYNDSVYVGVDLYYISLFQSNSVAYDDKHRM